MALPGLPQGTLAKVDCGSCTKCCKGFQAVALMDGEDTLDYRCHEVGTGVWLLDHKPNGDCVYLEDDRCSIWGRHPRVCKEFDCAGFVQRMDEGAFEGWGPVLIGGPVIKEGRKRLRRQRKAA